MFKTSRFNDNLNIHTQIYAKKQENSKINFVIDLIIKCYNNVNAKTEI